MFKKTNKHLESYKIIDNTLNALPPHKQIHEDLIVFKDLIPWIFRSNCYFNDHEQKKTYFNDIKQNYIETVRQLYLLELVPFCSCAKAKINKHEKPKTSKKILAKNFLVKIIQNTLFFFKQLLQWKTWRAPWWKHWTNRIQAISFILKLTPRPRRRSSSCSPSCWISCPCRYSWSKRFARISSTWSPFRWATRWICKAPRRECLGQAPMPPCSAINKHPIKQNQKMTCK